MEFCQVIREDDFMNTINGMNMWNKTKSTFGKQNMRQNANQPALNQDMRDKLRGTAQTEREVGINSILSSSRNYFEQVRASRQQANATSTKVKQLKYQFKDMSSKIIRSKTSNAAKQVAGQARRELLRLKREKFSNKDDSAEMEAAINHAKSMERVAKKKAKHLEEEELAKVSGGPCEDKLIDKNNDLDDILTEEELSEAMSEDITEDMPAEASEEILSEEELEELEELSEEFSDEMTEELSQLLEDLGLEELTEEIIPAGEDMDPQDLKELKIKHRNKEMKEIVKADAEYMKALFEGYEKAKSGAEPVVQAAAPAVSVSAPVIDISL